MGFTPLSTLSTLSTLLWLLMLLPSLPTQPPSLLTQPPPTTPPPPSLSRRSPSPTPTPTVSLMITPSPTSRLLSPEMLPVLSEDPTLSISLTAVSRLSPTTLIMPMVMWLRFLTLERLCILLLLLVDILVRVTLSLLPLHTTPKSLHCVFSIFISYLLDTQYIQN